MSSVIKPGTAVRSVSAQHRNSHPARDTCLAPSRAVDRPAFGARYGRMFPDAPPLGVDPDAVLALGLLGGVCDTATLDPTVDCDSAGAAGWPMLGQFIAHDLTADRSPLTLEADISGLQNAGSPDLDLEPLYGEGPVGAPYLYRRDDPAKLLTSADGNDLARNHEGIALIADPRNDVHVFMTQLHLLFVKMHNLLVDRLRADGVAEADLFDQARRASAWHFQWIVLHDFLPRLIGQDLVDELLAEGPRYYKPGDEPYVPIEFADGAYRYGHGQVRETYRLQPGGPALPLFPDLFGFGPCRAGNDVDLSRVFDVPGREPADRAPKIDGTMPTYLLQLPEAITGTVTLEAHRSLAVRDLQRGVGTALPSGEWVAEHFGVEPLTPEETGLDRATFAVGTPLWFYVLKEAQHRAGGERLGPVGGRIVGEVLVGLLRTDHASQLSVDPAWRPTLPSAQPGTFTMADVIVATGG